MNKKIKLILICILIINTYIFFFSIFKIFTWYQDNKKTNTIISNIQEIVKIKEQDKTITTEVLDNSRYYNEKLLSVDFTNLLIENEEIVGWIEIPNTNINYPFVKHKDNSYYLNHSLDKSYNTAGWIFLDYRNNMNPLDENTILYAHGRVDGTMFGTLKDTLSNTWQEKEQFFIRISTLSYNYLFEIFSAYHIRTTNDYLTTNFKDKKEYQKFLNKITTRSMVNFNTKVSTENKILTLSTCYNNKEKMVVHGKLVKREKRY